jgi:hypothetical protein
MLSEFFAQFDPVHTMPFTETGVQAYTTNDMHLQAVERVQARNITLRNRLSDITEQFIRRALE